MPNVLVAGGAGYIGSHVSKLLSKRGYHVVVLDNLSHGYREFARFGDFVQGDIGDASLLDSVFERYSIDAVMHFCAFIEVGESVSDPMKYYDNNVKNTLTLIQAMRRHGVSRFIFSSTAAVYGMPRTVPILEDSPRLPINPYGASKAMVEQMLEDFSSAYSFESIRFRYFNAAGCDPDCEIGEAHVPESHLIPLILDAADGRRESIKVFGTDYPTRDGTAIRDYVHVNDLADAHIRGLEYLLNGGKSNFFNLGSGEGFSVNEILASVENVTGRTFKIVNTERRAGDPPVLIANSQKARDILHWTPEFDLPAIIRTAWNWHQNPDQNPLHPARRKS